MDKPFVLEEYYDVPANKVWHALTDLHAMKVWYFPQLKRFQLVVGFEMGFDDDGSPYRKQWRITQVVNGRKWAHTWTYIGYPGSSEVIFELIEEGSRTRLVLTHTGLASFPNEPHFVRRRFEEGWKQIISHKLKNYLQ
jgi:uncharacterized protein YndB with AHSA1/START domain